MLISRRSLLRNAAVFSVLGITGAGCEKPHGKPVELTIDWIPAPEYYGIFLAQSSELPSAGYAATVVPGTGAPTLAAQVAAGAVSIGTTTSDNIARQIERGAQFSAVVPLFRFNPSSFGSFASPIASVRDVAGKTIGVNKNSVTYQQFTFLIRKYGVSPDSFREVPIGFGGVPELLNGTIDILTGYSTNQMVDADMQRQPFFELTFDSIGVHSYGLVLAFAQQRVLLSKGLDESDIPQIAKCILNGYARGAAIPLDAVDRLITVEPALGSDRRRLLRAVSKIADRSEVASRAVPPSLDDWLSAEHISEASIVASRDFMVKGLRDVS